MLDFFLISAIVPETASASDLRYSSLLPLRRDWFFNGHRHGLSGCSSGLLDRNRDRGNPVLFDFPADVGCTDGIDTRVLVERSHVRHPDIRRVVQILTVLFIQPSQALVRRSWPRGCSVAERDAHLFLPLCIYGRSASP